MKNWTKWYKKTLDKTREKNKIENEDAENLTEREKATRELLLKQYGLTEKTVQNAKTSLGELQKKSLEDNRINEVKRTLEKNNVKEEINRKGINNADAEEKIKKYVDANRDSEKENIDKTSNAQEDELRKNLKSRIDEINSNTAKGVQELDEKYEQISESKYKYLKNRIDYLLHYNDTGKGDIFYNIKDDLHKLIEENKASLSKERYGELKAYVDSKIFIDSSADKKNVTLYVNDKELVLTEREFEWSTKITYKSHNPVGMVYGELIKVQYEGNDYKVKVGTMAPIEEVNIVKAIASRKKEDITVGLCISYNNKVYIYSGEKVWRYLVDRGGNNYNDGYAALIKQCEEDIYADTQKGESEDGK